MRTRRCLCVVLAATVLAENTNKELQYELMNACADGNAEDVRRLLGAGASAQFTTDSGETPLHVAGIGGSAAVVNLLVAHGGDVDKRVLQPRGLYMTPLTWMVYGTHADGVEALLANNASPDLVVVDEQGTKLTALDIALDRVQRQDIAALIQAHGGRRFRDIPADDLAPVLPRGLIAEQKKDL